jgi:two-component system phosphate regulon sensor histidine kinase PhoR
VKRRWRRRVSPIFLVFPAILLAAAALGRYAYVQSRALGALSEEAIRQSNAAIADQVVSVIEKQIIASDHTLFDLIDLANLKRFTDRWNENVRLSPTVDAAIVLDEKQRILAVASRGRTEARLRARFERRILPELHLDSLELGQHAHLHADFDGEPTLVSYTHRRSAGRDYYIALFVDMGNVIGNLLPQELEDLRDTSRFSVVDSSGRVVYGDRLDRKSGFLYEKPFPSTLWRWRVQMAPRNIWQLASESRKRRTADVLLIGFALSIIVLGMLVLLLAIRKERRAGALKSEFIANVSHELKTPLSLIRMFAELIGSGRVKSPETGREYTEIITRESERLSQLIDNVLDFARIERGKAAYEFAPGDLGDVVNRALEVYRHRLERERIRLVLEIEPGLPQASLDQDAMTLALLNLLENAVKYAGPGDLMLRLRRGGDQLELQVADQGPGIPESEHRRVFERFYRAKNARDKSVRGSGIGLSLVKHVAEAHGGWVRLVSEPGKGATFTVVVPALPESEPVLADAAPAQSRGA